MPVTVHRRKMTLAQNAYEQLTEVIDHLIDDPASACGMRWQNMVYFSSEHRLGEYSQKGLAEMMGNHINKIGYELELPDGPASSLSMRDAGEKDFTLYPLNGDFMAALKHGLAYK